MKLRNYPSLHLFCALLTLFLIQSGNAQSWENIGTLYTGYFSDLKKSGNMMIIKEVNGLPGFAFSDNNGESFTYPEKTIYDAFIFNQEFITDHGSGLHRYNSDDRSFDSLNTPGFIKKIWQSENLLWLATNDSIYFTTNVNDRWHTVNDFAGLKLHRSTENVGYVKDEVIMTYGDGNNRLMIIDTLGNSQLYSGWNREINFFYAVNQDTFIINAKEGFSYFLSTDGGSTFIDLEDVVGDLIYDVSVSNENLYLATEGNIIRTGFALDNLLELSTPDGLFLNIISQGNELFILDVDCRNGNQSYSSTDDGVSWSATEYDVGRMMPGDIKGDDHGRIYLKSDCISNLTFTYEESEGWHRVRVPKNFPYDYQDHVFLNEYWMISQDKIIVYDPVKRSWESRPLPWTTYDKLRTSLINHMGELQVECDRASWSTSDGYIWEKGPVIYFGGGEVIDDQRYLNVSDNVVSIRTFGGSHIANWHAVCNPDNPPQAEISRDSQIWVLRDECVFREDADLLIFDNLDLNAIPDTVHSSLLEDKKDLYFLMDNEDRIFLLSPEIDHYCMVSDDGGKSFRSLSTGVSDKSKYVDAHFVAPDNTIYIAQREGSVYRLDNFTTSVSREIARDMEFIIYPNPSTNRVFISPENDNISYEIQLLDAMGREVQSMEAEGNASFRTQELSSGIYYMVISDSKGLMIQSSPVIVQ